MNTLLFCTSYIRTRKEWINRYKRWINYYDDGKIENTRRILIDDGSPYLPETDEIRVIPDNENASNYNDNVMIVHFKDNLGRHSISDYPGWWRSFFFSLDIALEFNVDKIVHIESDAYILNKNLAKFINSTTKGWSVLWTPHYSMPETAIQIICSDQFDSFRNFQDNFHKVDKGKLAEHLLPFTSVNKDFKGDRYSETLRKRGLLNAKIFGWIPGCQEFFWGAIPKDADFATQVIKYQKLP